MGAKLGLLLAVVGCSSASESHGTTAKQYVGTINVVFINATPERLCGLYISYDTEPEYGDNWIPEGGLPVGQSLELKIKPGTYKAKWNTCKDARDRPTMTYAATLVGGTAFPIEEPLQLYAFVSDGTAPTKRGVPRPRMKMIKFIGQPTQIAATPEPTPTTTAETPPQETPPTESTPPATHTSTGPMMPPIWIPIARPAPAAAPAVAVPPPPPPPAPPSLGPPGSTLFKPK